MEKKTKTKKDISPKNVSAQDQAKNSKKDFLVVGLGASAGGVKALQEFFATMPSNSGMAFVAILHLSPEHESNLAQILQAQTSMKVTQVTKTVKVEPNNVYVIPPNQQLEMIDGVIRPTIAERPAGYRIAIDVFFRTLAEAYEKNAVCVVLSGTGSDGTLGLKRVKESNGFAIVQDPEDAEYDSMPRAAINTQLADWVLPVHRMPEKLIHFKESSERLHLTNGADAKQIAEEIHADESLREILTLLRVRTGHDFSNYKTPTLVRRIARHLQIHELEDIPSYLELLRNTPNELQSLLKNLLINVTNFFRDKEAFAALEAEIVPNLFAGKTGKDTIRVWSAGCASGEEAFSLAMLLAEYADPLPDPPKIQVFASDVDDEAIAEAREHRYPESIEADVSQERLKNFFTKEGSYYRVKKELRETVLFAPHNVLRDPPFSRLDLVSCRNLLIYLNRDTQERVLQIFHFALNSNGSLFLGSSETAENTATIFSPVDKKHRIYSRRNAPVSQTSLPMMPVVGRWEVRLPERKSETMRDRATTLGDIHYRLLENYAPSSALVNQDFDIFYLSGTANRFLRFTGGEPSRNLLKAVVPDLLPDLRAALFTAQREHKSSEFPNIRVRIDGEETTINLIVRAVDVQDEASDFLLVIFEEKNSPIVQRKAEQEISKIADKDEAMETVVRRLEEDLQRTKEHLRTTIEQHETTVEELKASNEELQAINEELRSASEELETSKEELQSVNEELTTVNHELKDKIDETSRINSDLSNLMAATDIATIFLDKQLKIKRYTPPVEGIFNITPIDVGRPLEHFTHHLRYENLSVDAEKALRSLTTIEHEITDDKSRSYLSRFAPYRTIDDRIDGVVLNFIDITARKKAEQAVRDSEERLQKAIAIETVGVIFFNNDIEVIDCNDAFVRMSGYTRKELRSGKFNWEAFTPDDFGAASRRAIEEMRETGSATPYEKEYVRKDGSRFWALFAAKRINDNEIVEFVTDITEQKQAEAVMRESEEKYRTLFDSIDEGVQTIEIIFDENDKAVDFRYLETNPAITRLSGLTPEVVGKRVSEIIPNLEPFWFETYERVIKTGEPVRFEHQVAGLNDQWFDVYASRVGGNGSRQVVVVFNNITKRKRVEANLAFLAEISQDLAKLTNIDETINRLGAKIGEYFNVARVVFGEISEDQETGVVTHEWHRADLSDIRGSYKAKEYFSPEFETLHRAGEIAVVSDVAGDTRIDAKRYAALGVGAFVGVPLIREGKWRSYFSLLDSKPHDWTDAEIELIREITDRIWIRLERAHAEEALRESEKNYRMLFDSIDEGFCTIEVLFDKKGKAIDYRFLETNPAFARLTGIENGIGRSMREIAPDHEEFWFETYGRIVKTGEAERFEHKALALGRFYDVYAFPIGASQENRVAIIFSNIAERKQAQELLAKSEEHLRAIINQNLAGIFEIDLTGKIIFANDELCRMLGYECDTLSTVPLEDFIHPEDLPESLKKLERMQKDKKPFEIEKRFVKKDGSIIWVHNSVSPITNGDKKIHSAVVVSLDITQRKEAEFRLRKAEERTRITLEAAELATWEWNVETGEVLWNEQHFRLFGMKPRKKALTTDDFFRHVHPDFRDYVAAELKKSVDEKVPFDAEFCALLTGGETRWMSGYGRVTQIGKNGETMMMSGVMFDITERKSAAEALRKNQEQLQLILESTKDYSIITFDLKGIITRWNTGAERIFGYTESEMVGQKGDILFTPEDRAAKVPAQEFQIAIKKGRAEDERWHLRKDGSRFFASGVMQPLKDGEIEGFVKIARDQTERLAVENALREKETLEKLVAAQEDERKRIARDLHDELGQKLTALRMKLDTAIKNCADAKLLTQLYEIQQTAAHVDEGVDFLAFELRPSVLDDFGLVATLDNYIKQWSNYSGVSADFVVSNLKKTRFKSEVETCLYRIAQETLNNIHKHAKAENVEVVLEILRDQLILIVEDNGKGFSLKTKSKRGKGIGLIGMKERVELVGGTLEIETAPKKGTTVYVRIPLSVAKE